MNSNDSVEYIYDDSAEAIKWVSVGFGIGLLVGGIVGLLLAPKSGQETREQLKTYAEDLSEKTKDAAQDLASKTKAGYATASEKVTQTTMDAKDKLRDVAGSASEALKAGKEAINKVAAAIHSNESEA